MTDSPKVNADFPWDSDATAKFQEMLRRMPVFARPMAERPVARKAEQLAVAGGQSAVSVRYLIDAFFEVTPFGFHGPMMTDMEAVGLDYRSFGHPRDYTRG